MWSLVLYTCVRHATPVRISRCLITIHTCAVYFLPFFIDSFTCSNTTRCCIIRNLLLLLWCTPKQCDLQIRTTHIIYTFLQTNSQTRVQTHGATRHHSTQHHAAPHCTTLQHHAVPFSAHRTPHTHTRTPTLVCPTLECHLGGGHRCVSTVDGGTLWMLHDGHLEDQPTPVWPRPFGHHGAPGGLFYFLNSAHPKVEYKWNGFSVRERGSSSYRSIARKDQTLHYTSNSDNYYPKLWASRSVFLDQAKARTFKSAYERCHRWKVEAPQDHVDGASASSEIQSEGVEHVADSFPGRGSGVRSVHVKPEGVPSVVDGPANL